MANRGASRLAHCQLLEANEFGGGRSSWGPGIHQGIEDTGGCHGLIGCSPTCQRCSVTLCHIPQKFSWERHSPVLPLDRDVALDRKQIPFHFPPECLGAPVHFRQPCELATLGDGPRAVPGFDNQSSGRPFGTTIPSLATLAIRVLCQTLSRRPKREPQPPLWSASGQASLDAATSSSSWERANLCDRQRASPGGFIGGDGLERTSRITLWCDVVKCQAPNRRARSTRSPSSGWTCISPHKIMRIRQVKPRQTNL